MAFGFTLACARVDSVNETRAVVGIPDQRETVDAVATRREPVALHAIAANTPRMKKILAVLLMLFLSATVHAADALQPAARTLVLVRHGNYVEDPSVDARLGPGLSPIGVAQAHLAGARLAGMAPHFDALYVSPMRRARDTAAVIATNFPGRHYTKVDDLAECTPPTRRSEITMDETPTDLAACQAQLDRVVATYFKPASGSERSDLLVCHGNVIRYLVTRALGVDTTAWLEMSVGHASITTIRVEADGRFKVIAVGEVGHVPPNLRTGATGDAARTLAIPMLP
jgi:serine/threonine-protein phosphatase PGAM5